MKKYKICVHEMNLSQQEKYKIAEMSLALIRDLYGNDNDFEEESIRYMSLLDKYLELENK